MNPIWSKLVRNLRMHAAPRRLTAMLSILTALTLLFSFAASAQPALAAPPPPTVNGLFWGDGDHAEYQPIAYGILSDSVLYEYVDTASETLYVAFVVDGNLNDNAFDMGQTPYMASAGWPDKSNARPFFHLMNSEFAEFTAEICDAGPVTWQQGYGRQLDAEGNEIGLKDSDFNESGWTSSYTVTNGSGTVPAGYNSSSSIVWNLNHYADAATKTFDMGVRCDENPTLPCTVYDWKSPFVDGDSDTVTNTGGFPEVISTTTPISHSFTYDWEWAMVYEWSVSLKCDDGSVDLSPTVSSGTTHHSPSKLGISDDPTPVTLIALAASTSAALLPIAGLVVGVSGVIVAPRRRRRRDQ